LRNNPFIQELINLSTNANLSISECVKTPLKELLTEYQVNQNVKEQYSLLTTEF